LPLLEASESTKTATRAQWAFTLHVIESRAFTQSVSPATGRVFNVITGTASVLRPHLRLDGRPVVEVDVRACQPFLLATLYPKDSLERAKYLTAVTTGDFYELFRPALTTKADSKRPARSRKVLKLAVQIQVLFGGPNQRRELWDLFAATFPELAGLIDRFIKEGSTTLAAHLQKLESGIVIERVVPRLLQELQGRPFLTIHDSILCIRADAATVAKIMEEEFAARVGATPRMKVTCYEGVA